jgi:hypothetical protein
VVLGQQDERLVRMPAGGHLGLGPGDILQAATDMDRGGTFQPGRLPRDRPIQRPVELEHAGSVAESLVPAPDPV